jgi:glycosyltransferase involved in cell wall biosynthesis
MIVTFVVPSTRVPVGGARSAYECANAFVRRGHDVNIVHITLTHESVLGMEDLAWFDFEDDVRHYFPGSTTSLPRADFVFACDESFPAESGLPLVFVRGINLYPRDVEKWMFTYPCPYVCVARWLVDVGRSAGVPEEQLVYVPNGLKHDKYRVLRPIEQRPPRVAVCYSTHHTKGAVYAIEALERAKEQVPELMAVLFGTWNLQHRVPDWMTYLQDPPQEVIVHDVYNGSRLFLSASVIEGTGNPSIEAMACGCALVTSSTRGSDEFAIDGETALVSSPRDVDAMARNIVTLLSDDALRLRLARAGNEYVRRFDWDESARTLEEFLLRYAAEPERYRQPVRPPAGDSAATAPA